MAIGVLPRDRNIVHEQVMARDLRAGGNKYVIHTLGNAGVVTTFTIPDWATGVKLFPVANPVTFAFGGDVVDNNKTGSGTTLDLGTTNAGIGGYARNDQWEVRILDNGTGRTLQIVANTNATVVIVEAF